MKLESTRQLPVSQQAAWDALNNLAVLKDCIPGCESLVETSPGCLDAVVVTRIGPVSARFGGKVTLEDIAPPNSYRLVFSGQGGTAGFAKGEAQVNLTSISNDSTQLHYVATAAVGGKLAQIGSRLIESTAKKLAEDFFSRFEAQLTADSQDHKQARTDIGTQPNDLPPSIPAPQTKSATVKWVGMAVLVAVGAAILYLATVS